MVRGRIDLVIRFVKGAVPEVVVFSTGWVAHGAQVADEASGVSGPRLAGVLPPLAFRAKRRADPEFIMEWFNTEADRLHFLRNGKTTSGLGTLNSNDIRTAPVPLPPDLDTQRTVVQRLREVRRKAGAKRQQAAKLREAAWADFLTAIFR